MEQNKNNTIRFEFSGWRNRDVIAHGVPELEVKHGIDIGEKMAMFWGKGYEMYVVNTENGRIRKFSDEDGNVLVGPHDIDMESINLNCENGVRNAISCIQEYARMNRYDDFKDGVAALCWTLYPDGRYFEDEDGFGAESNNEEIVYCLIDRDLKIIRPFAFVPDIKKLLKETAESK